jgi:hypothetical protein
VDVSSVLNKTPLLLNKIAEKADLLRPFKSQQSSVDLIVDESSYTFKDYKSKVTFSIPPEQYLSNAHIPAEELEEKLSVGDSTYIFKVTLQEYLTERLAIFAKRLSATSVKLKFEQGKATVTVTSNDENEKTRAELVQVDLDPDHLIEGLYSFPVQPLLLAKEMEIECYRRQDGANLQLRLIFELEDLPIEIWLTATLTIPNSKCVVTKGCSSRVPLALKANDRKVQNKRQVKKTKEKKHVDTE